MNVQKQNKNIPGLSNLYKLFRDSLYKCQTLYKCVPCSFLYLRDCVAVGAAVADPNVNPGRKETKGKLTKD